MALAKTGNVAKLVAFLGKEGANAYFSPDDFLECAAEHGEKQALETGLKAAFKVEGPDSSEREWIDEKRDDVLRTIRRRAR